ncbi:hypothetical protein AB0M47_18605 [Hamadaea sp. NPDC051192]
MNTWYAKQTRHLPVFAAALAMVDRKSVLCGKPESGSPDSRRRRP